MKKSTLTTGIAVSVAFVFFVLFFSDSFFPRIAVLDIFRSSFDTSRTLLGGESTTLDGTNLVETINNDVSIIDIENGRGVRVKDGDTVRVGYIGTYIDDNGESVEFDKNTDPAAGFPFTVGSGQVIPGFELGVSGMRQGGKRLIIIAPEAGYGDQQVGNIPPNTTLQFIVELYEIQ